MKSTTSRSRHVKYKKISFGIQYQRVHNLFEALFEEKSKELFVHRTVRVVGYWITIYK